MPGTRRAKLNSPGNLDIVRMLLEHDTNVDAKCNWGDTHLHVAVDRRRPNIARMQIEYNANVNAKDKWGLTPANVDAKDEWGTRQ
jgi:ankyrin repeat protein